MAINKKDPLKHGSLLIVFSPDAKKSRRFLDFGPGFYTTPNGEMARKWAQTKMRIYKKEEGYINFYECPDLPPYLKILRFDKMSEDWLDFIIDNRNKPEFKHDYDIVIGPTADLKINRIILDYEQGVCDKTKTLEKLKNKQVGTQISFHTKRSTDLLKLVKAVKISNSPPGTKQQKNNGPHH